MDGRQQRPLLSNIAVVSGSTTALEAFEPAFQQDLNGDGVIGLNLPTTVIESHGSTSLTQVGNNYFLYANGPRRSGADLQRRAGRGGSIWHLGADRGEQTASGYDVAWKVAGADQYTVWTVDSSGHYLSNIGSCRESSTALEAFEPAFQQDLNGDG